MLPDCGVLTLSSLRKKNLTVLVPDRLYSLLCSGVGVSVHRGQSLFLPPEFIFIFVFILFTNPIVSKQWVAHDILSICLPVMDMYTFSSFSLHIFTVCIYYLHECPKQCSIDSLYFPFFPRSTLRVSGAHQLVVSPWLEWKFHIGGTVSFWFIITYPGPSTGPAIE